tara:strand:+ start:2327 stop:3124 length:798 start_codon:yes stop_codon:yes gene_type:complete
MSVIFIPKGRLGNALFRYLACSIFSIKYNLKYDVNIHGKCMYFNDGNFNNFIKHDDENNLLKINKSINYIFNGFYQHDMIYRKYKKELFEYINSNKDHYVLTDGINAGDGNKQKFYIKDFVNTPNNFKKIYEFVLHIRLGDKVRSNVTLSIDAIKNVIKKIDIPSNSCIVVNKPKNDSEKKFVNELKDYINSNEININIESNDILTDFHIMKNAETLVCSVSTISWCAAYFSDKIKKCYLPDYPKYVNPACCKYPIDNTELYKYN